MISERSRIERRKFYEELEAEEQRKREEQERPIKEAEASLQKTPRELFRIERENVQHLKDDALFISEPMKNATMRIEQATAFNATEAERFIQQTPDYYKCSENVDALTGYFERNGLEIADC